MTEWIPLLQKSRLFSGVEGPELAELLTWLDGRVVSGRRGEILLHTGDPVSRLGIVLTGRLLIVREDFWGNRNVLSVAGPGESFAETFACLPGSRSTVNVVAQEDCCVLYLDMARVFTDASAGKGSASRGRLLGNLLRELAEKNLNLNEKVTHMGQRTTRAKVLSYLSAQAQRQGSDRFTIPFSRQQLADYLSVDRSGLSQELSRMRQEGLLEYHKNHFVLKNAGEEAGS